MKNIFVIVLVLALAIPTFSQKAEKAPFGGKLIDKSQNIVLIYERNDGSEITRMPNGKWYLTKESKSENAKPIPSWVHKQQPMRIIYTATNGKEYFTNDGLNWMRYNDTPQQPSKPSINNEQIIAKPLKSPIVFDKLNIELMTSQSSAFRIVIYDLQGIAVYEETKVLSPGLNNLEINTITFLSGTYFYVISDGISTVNGLFIKY